MIFIYCSPIPTSHQRLTANPLNQPGRQKCTGCSNGVATDAEWVSPGKGARALGVGTQVAAAPASTQILTFPLHWFRKSLSLAPKATSRPLFYLHSCLSQSTLDWFHVSPPFSSVSPRTLELHPILLPSCGKAK